MWLACVTHLAAQLLIGFRKGAGAIHDALASLDHNIGVGADHFQVAGAK